MKKSLNICKLTALLTTYDTYNTTTDDGAMTHREINYRLPDSHLYFLTSSTTTLVSHASEIKNATSASSLTSFLTTLSEWKSHENFHREIMKKKIHHDKESYRWGASSTDEKMKIYRNELGLTCFLCGQVWSAIISFLKVNFENYSCFLHLNKE